MTSDERYIKLGIEKPSSLNKDFDGIYEKYRKKALNAGYTGSLMFLKERGKILVYVVI